MSARIKKQELYTTLLCVSQNRVLLISVLSLLHKSFLSAAPNKMLATDLQILCSFDSLANMKIGHVCDMKDNMLPSCRQHDTGVCRSGREPTQHKTTYYAKKIEKREYSASLSTYNKN